MLPGDTAEPLTLSAPGQLQVTYRGERAGRKVQSGTWSVCAAPKALHPPGRVAGRGTGLAALPPPATGHGAFSGVAPADGGGPGREGAPC